MSRTMQAVRGLKVLTAAAALVLLAQVPGLAHAQRNCINDTSATGPEGRDLPASQCGLKFNLVVPAVCTASPNSCGLVVVLNGITLTGAVTDQQLGFSKMAADAKLVVALSTANPSILDLPAYVPQDENRILSFIDEAMTDLKLDRNRLHIQGFSQGAGLTLQIICDRPGMVASAAVIAPAGGGRCFDSGLPVQGLLIVQSSKDQLVPPARTRQTANQIVAGMGLQQRDGMVIDRPQQDSTVTRFMDSRGKNFTFFQHTMDGARFGGGHCFPGSLEGRKVGADANGAAGSGVGGILQAILGIVRNGQDANEVVAMSQFGCNGSNAFMSGERFMKFFMENPARPGTNDRRN